MTPLHQIGEFLRQTFAMIPLGVVRLLFLGFLTLTLLWVLRLPKDQVTPPDGTGRWDENLKLGASIALVIQLIVYSLF
jgi:hypothetical protein